MKYLKNYNEINEGFKENIIISLISLSLLNSCSILKHKDNIEDEDMGASAFVYKDEEDTKLPKMPINNSLYPEFYKNIGNLPWPVKNGKIINTFGINKVKHVNLINNGITISTCNNSKICPIFNGKISKILDICGEKTVIVAHKNYYTVYVGFNDLESDIIIGKKVTNNTILGYSKNEINFQIWLSDSKTSKPVDPIKYLKKINNYEKY